MGRKERCPVKAAAAVPGWHNQEAGQQKTGRRKFKGMKTTILLLTLTSSLTLAQIGPDKVAGPMRKYGGTQLVRTQERQASLEEIQVWSNFRSRFGTDETALEFSCYLPDYLRTFFINGKRVPGAPHPADYCRARRQADVDAGIKPPLHELGAWNKRKAEEKFYRENPDANPWAKEEAEQAKTNKPSANPEWDKIDEKFGRTNK